MKAPAIFLGHGSPMNAIEDNRYTKEWTDLGKEYRPKGILMVSGHWYTQGTRIWDQIEPVKVDDMYGFPKELYDLKYPVKTALELVGKIKDKLGESVTIDNSWGLDHGAWSILVHMYPEADIPLLQISIDRNKTPRDHYELGVKLKELRNEGYMILGSGNVVHNLRHIDFNMKSGYSWAVDFDDYIEQAVVEGDHDKVINYESLGQAAGLSVPTPDHFYPLLVILGASDSEDKVRVVSKGYDLGSTSMTGFVLE